jgi:dolichyl-phosphate beta-glucosyltransferase
VKRPDLSVVIPVYNEERRVGATLREGLAFLRKRRIAAEVLVVDDGSTDGTLRAVAPFRAQAGRGISLRVLSHEVNRGKGAAVKTGMMAARGLHVLYMDADNSTPLSEYAKIGPTLKDFEVVVGSRAVDRSQVEVHQPFYREAMGRIFNLIVQVLAVPGIRDTQCGFKAFRGDCAKKIFERQTIERFGFDPEILFIARRLGYRLAEVQVRWINSPDSRVRVVRDSTRMLLELLTIRRNAGRGLYDR